MATAKILISLPEELASRVRAAIPPGNISKVLRDLLQKEVLKREQKLYEAAVAVEKDSALNEEMADWEVTTGDGIDNDEAW